MSNMSYCRFQNTYKDLEDCYENWDNNLDEDEVEEKEAKKKLLKLCKDIVEDYEW